MYRTSYECEIFVEFEIFETWYKKVEVIEDRMSVERGTSGKRYETTASTSFDAPHIDKESDKTRCER